MTALPLLITVRCNKICKGQPGGRYSLFFYTTKFKKKEKICCGGLARLLLTDDAEYPFTCVRDE
jgi:hypothetical protein